MDLKSYLVKKAVGGALRTGNGPSTPPVVPNLYERVQGNPRRENGQMEVTFKLKGAESWLTSSVIDAFGEETIRKQNDTGDFDTGQGRFIYVTLEGGKMHAFEEELTAHRRGKIAESNFRG